MNDADNVEWTAPTAMDGTVFSDGLIFINEDNSNGEIWMDEPDGSNPILIADTAGVSGATETTGIFDISDLVGYNPGSILLTNNQSTNSSMTGLINPDATLDDANFDGDNDIDGADFLTWQRNFGTGTLPSQGDAENGGDVDSKDLTAWESQYGGTPPLAAAAASVPEPSSASLTCCSAYWSASLLASNEKRPQPYRPRPFLFKTNFRSNCDGVESLEERRVSDSAAHCHGIDSGLSKKLVLPPEL